MTTLNRLKLELSNKPYFTDAEYKVLLDENGLKDNEEYNKETMQRKLLLTVLDVLNALTNNIEMFRKLEDGITGFSQSQAYSQLSKRIEVLKNRIDTLPTEPTEQYSCVKMLFSRRR